MKGKAAVLYEMGRPQPYAASRPLEIEEIDVQAPGPGEVLVKVAAAGLCHSDLSAVNGVRPWPLPIVLGHEASGVVEEVGAHVTHSQAGDHVVFSYVPSCGRCEFCLDGRPALCLPGSRSNRDGALAGGHIRFRNRAGTPLHHHLGVSAFAEYTVVSEHSVVKIDRHVPLEQAAIFGCAVVTGVGAVLNTAGVTPGESVAVFGLGGVGLSAILGARAAGAWPIVAVDRVPSKLDLARELGATHTVDATEADAVETVREITGGGAHVAFEAVGHEAVWQSVFRATRRGGQAVAIGVAAPDVEYRVPAVSLVGEGKQIKGCYMGSAVPQRDVPRFLELYVAGRLPVDRLLSRTVPLAQINEALDALAAASVARQLIAF